MTVAARISRQRGLLSDADVNRLIAVLRAYALPTTIAAEKSAVKDALKKDKKRYGDRVKFVLLEAIGRAVIEDVSLNELEQVVETL